MTLGVLLVLAAALLLLNAFFVLAEFAVVKLRASRVEELAAEGRAGAGAVQQVQAHLDEYLSVCQVGITLASIGLGFVGEPAFAELFQRALGFSSWAAHAVALPAAYVVISLLHIVFGEQVPKMVALYRPERSALLVGRPLQKFRRLFWFPLVVLTGATRAVLRAFGIRGPVREAAHSEDELRTLLARSQSTGLMSFRRLLLMENIFDLGTVKVRDAMRPRGSARVLRAEAPWEENFKVIRESRCSRYPLVEARTEMPVGIVHVKELLHEGPEGMARMDLRKIARPYLVTTLEAPLEELLGRLQGRRGHLALVRDAQGGWAGFLSLEDILEEVVGTIEDEFEAEPPLFLADTISEGRVVLGVQAPTLADGIAQALGRVKEGELPLPAARLQEAILERERVMSTYLGNGLAVPHARMEGLPRPVLVIARSDEGIPVPGRSDRARLLFILVTPSGEPRAQARLMARICTLLESEYVTNRLLRAQAPAEVLEAVCAGEPLTVR